ncbi:hypothetical protein C8R48DRAFT_775186 [Suillus tomentosus]|nr:hypothetical protein C8R48DRAFT_775186 [Suillus tomentosus]
MKDHDGTPYETLFLARRLADLPIDAEKDWRRERGPERKVSRPQETQQDPQAFQNEDWINTFYMGHHMHHASCIICDLKGKKAPEKRAILAAAAERLSSGEVGLNTDEDAGN